MSYAIKSGVGAAFRQSLLAYLISTLPCAGTTQYRA